MPIYTLQIQVVCLVVLLQDLTCRLQHKSRAVLHRRCPAVHSHDIIDTAVVAATCAQASHQELGVGPPCKRAPLCVGLFRDTTPSWLSPLAFHLDLIKACVWQGIARQASLPHCPYTHL